MWTESSSGSTATSGQAVLETDQPNQRDRVHLETGYNFGTRWTSSRLQHDLNDLVRYLIRCYALIGRIGASANKPKINANNRTSHVATIRVTRREAAVGLMTVGGIPARTLIDTRHLFVGL